jgi:hypothetical protein
VTTFTDGTPPSVNPGPDDVPGDRRTRDDAQPNGARRDTAHPDDADAGATWLRDEIQRRISEGNAVSSKGRHSRHGPAPTTSYYVPRHSVATPGPGAPRPGPVGGQMSPQASELLRRERAAARPAWSGPSAAAMVGPPAASPQAPPGDTVGNFPPVPATLDLPDPNATAPAPEVPAADVPEASGATAPRRVGPGLAAAAAMRGAALGRGRMKAARGSDAPSTADAPADPTGVLSGAPESSVESPATHPPAPKTAPVEQAPAEAGTPPVPPVFPPATTPPRAETSSTVRNPQVDPMPRGIVVPAQRGADELRGSRLEAPDDPANRRVRVVLAERKSVAQPVRTVVDVQEGTGVGALLRTNLIGSQLAVALRFAVGAGLALGLLPLLFAMVPEVGRMEVLGLRLPWLLLGVLVYPFLFGLGMWHSRAAERVEQNFADHVQD